MRYVLGGWQINASTFLRSGLTDRHAGQRRSDRRSGARESHQGALVQYLHAHRRRRAAGMCRRQRATGVQDPPQQRARHDRCAARGGLCRRSALSSTCRSSSRSASRSRINFQMRVEAFNADQRRAVGRPEHHGHQHARSGRSRRTRPTIRARCSCSSGSATERSSSCVRARPSARGDRVCFQRAHWVIRWPVSFYRRPGDQEENQWRFFS